MSVSGETCRPNISTSSPVFEITRDRSRIDDLVEPLEKSRSANAASKHGVHAPIVTARAGRIASNEPRLASGRRWRASPAAARLRTQPPGPRWAAADGSGANRGRSATGAPPIRRTGSWPRRRAEFDSDEDRQHDLEVRLIEQPALRLTLEEDLHQRHRAPGHHQPRVPLRLAAGTRPGRRRSAATDEEQTQARHADDPQFGEDADE